MYFKLSFLKNSGQQYIYTFFHKKNCYKKKSLKKPKNLKKVLRKSPASNAWAKIFKNADFS